MRILKNWDWLIFSSYIGIFWGTYIIFKDEVIFIRDKVIITDEWYLSFTEALTIFYLILICMIVVKCYTERDNIFLKYPNLEEILKYKVAPDYYPLPSIPDITQEYNSKVNIRGEYYDFKLYGFGKFIPFTLPDNVSKTINSYRELCDIYSKSITKLQQYKEQYYKEREDRLDKAKNKLAYSFITISAILVFCFSFKLLGINTPFVSLFFSTIILFGFGKILIGVGTLIILIPSKYIEPFIGRDLFKKIEIPYPPKEPYSLKHCLKFITENEKRLNDFKEVFGYVKDKTSLSPEEFLIQNNINSINDYIDKLVTITSVKESKANEIYWFNISPRQFEHDVAKYYIDIGLSAEVTQYSQDNGIDVIVKNSDGTIKYVQCKHFTKDKITIETVKELGGTMLVDNVKNGAIACLKGVTQGASIYMKKAGIELLTAEDLSKYYRTLINTKNADISKNSDYWIKIRELYLNISSFYTLDNAIKYVKKLKCTDAEKEYIITKHQNYHIIYGRKAILNIYFEENYNCWKVNN